MHMNMTSHPRTDPYYAQGMRCGHIDGKDRCGSYVMGEEYRFNYDAARYQGYAPQATDEWAEGYAEGYRIGANGDPLPDEVINAPLPT